MNSRNSIMKLVLYDAQSCKIPIWVFSLWSHAQDDCFLLLGFLLQITGTRSCVDEIGSIHRDGPAQFVSQYLYFDIYFFGDLYSPAWISTFWYSIRCFKWYRIKNRWFTTPKCICRCRYWITSLYRLSGDREKPFVWTCKLTESIYGLVARSSRALSPSRASTLFRTC